MRVLLINQYYYPDIAATAQLCTDLAEDLSALSHEVTVIAGTASYRTPHEGDRPVLQDRLPLSAEHRGVRILRVPVTSLGPSLQGPLQMMDRALGYAQFLGGAFARVLLAQRPDVVVALSTPPLVAALGLCSQALRATRFVYWVQDVYPDLAVALKVMRPGGLLARGFTALSRLLYRRADAIVALDEAMAGRLLAAGAPAPRIRVIDNWSDSSEVTPQAPQDNCLRRHLGLGAGFAVGYAGNLGRGHDFATLSAALPLLRDDPVSFVFIGGGPQKPPLLRQAAEQGLSHVHFLPPQSRAGIRDALTAGDVGLVTLDEGLAGLLVPSKVYGMLAAGRPILYVGPREGRVGEMLAREEIGESVRNGDVMGLVAAVRRLQADPARRARMGQRARQLFERVYRRRLATARHEAVLREVHCSGAAGAAHVTRTDMQELLGAEGQGGGRS